MLKPLYIKESQITQESINKCKVRETAPTDVTLELV